MKDLLQQLTPVENRAGLWFKRDDLFEPFGKGSVNGSKLRQLIWLIGTAKEKGAKGTISGAVSGSPQHVMCAVVSKHFGLKCVVYTGAKEIAKYPMLALAVQHGASVIPTNIGYAAALQKKAFDLQTTQYFKDYFVVETNITTDEKRNTPERIKDFHSIGAFQVQNIPDEVDTLVLPCGSCNSAVSVLYGLYLYPKPNIRTVYLMGIGSWGSKDIGYVFNRLLKFEPNASDLLESLDFKYYNINGEGYTSYEKTMPFSYEGIEFHPRYEGKIGCYARDKGLIEEWKAKNTLMWLVGSEPKV